MICFDFNVFVGFFLNITNSLLDGSEVACLLFPRWQLFCDNVAYFPLWNWMHSNIFRFFFRSVFQRHVVPSASRNACLLESVQHWLNVKVTPVLGAAYLSNPRWDRIHTFSRCWQIYYHSTLTLIQVHIHIQAKEFYLF